MIVICGLKVLLWEAGRLVGRPAGRVLEELELKPTQPSTEVWLGLGLRLSLAIKKSVLLDLSKALKSQLCKYVIKSFSKDRLLEVLKRAKIVGDDDEALLKVYHDALAVSEAGYQIVLKRDVVYKRGISFR